MTRDLISVTFRIDGVYTFSLFVVADREVIEVIWWKVRVGIIRGSHGGLIFTQKFLLRGVKPS